MTEKNIIIKAGKFLAKDILLDILIWPIWWYTTGVFESMLRLRDTIAQGNRELALSIWAKNIFVPMYGDYTWQGRLVSFFVRVFQVIIRSFLFLGWCFFALLIFVLWLLLPIFIIYQFVKNFFG